MLTEPAWWPLRLEHSEFSAVASFRSQLSMGAELRAPQAATIADALCVRMAEALPAILDRDSLPAIAHVLNGWGDLDYDGRRITERIAAFAHRDRDGNSAVLQKDPEGEFHPWQSFAYAVMAGADIDVPLGAGAPSLRELARTSRHLNTDDACELGHLLFALAFLDPALSGPPFVLTNGTFDATVLMRSAVVAHYAGHFEVCRKVHLTEGICAMAARVPGMAAFGGFAQRFLDGQMELLVVLALVIEETNALAVGARAARPQLLESLRDKLRIGTYLENHCYYAGHLIELACFADALGYQLKPEHRTAAVVVANCLNEAIGEHLDAISFLDCFLHFGHYRRAITLLAGSERGPQCSPLEPARLAAFTLDLASDSRRVLPHAAPAAVSRARLTGAYAVHQVPPDTLRPRFRDVVDAYVLVAPAAFTPRGGFSHFRRMGPNWWPRALHYELLDYHDRIGVEIHLEADAVASLAERLRRVASDLGTIRGRYVGWDPNWYRGRGRLRLVIDDSAPADEVAESTRELIDRTFSTLDRAVAALVPRDQQKP